MRKKIVAGNWKMNLSYAEAMSLAGELVDSAEEQGNCSVILAPPFIYLHDLVSRIQSHPDFSVAAQNCSSFERGAYTGEVAASMLTSIGVEHVIIGHSERRKIYGETNDQVAEKISAAIRNGVIPIFCCGEELSQRDSGIHFDVVRQQLERGLFHIGNETMKECIIAYEPVWAIGTGKTASAMQAQEMHAFIRNCISEKYGEVISSEVSILYGGSVTAQNSAELFSCSDVDGGLVGGASLKAREFLNIIQSMNTVTKAIS
jgi:triosephosphate isomerase